MADDSEKKVVVDFRQVGATGLRRFSGFIYEEFLNELIGWKAAKVYKEMGDNDATVSSILFAIDKLARRVPWRVQPVSDQPQDKEAAEFLETCMNDMDNTWIDTISEILSFLQYGHSLHETVYKQRYGKDSFDPSRRSKYSDGRIGWRGFPIRSQDTLYRWQFDDHGGIQGVEQLAPPHYYHVTIPVEKFLLFRTTVHKNNPEGRSILRGAYRSWYLKKNIENIEGIGIERDLAGLPMAMVPAEIMSENASPGQKALLAEIKKMVTNVRRDEQEGIVMPMVYDAAGKQLYDFKLLSTGGSRQLDVDKVITRYDQRIAMTCMADFLMLGQGTNGSWAMHSDKTRLFCMALGAFLDIIAEIFNNYAVPRLFALNDFQVTELPKIVHGDAESVDLKEIGTYIQQLSAAGMPMFPNMDLEKHLMKIANLPEPTDVMGQQDMEIETPPDIAHKDVQEIHDSPIQKPSGLDTPADTTPINDNPAPQTVVSNQSGNTEAQLAGGMPTGKTPSQFTDWRKW